MKVLTILAPGFEDLEALGTVALLRRAGMAVYLCSSDNTEKVTGKYNITVSSDILLKDVNVEDYDLLFIPGGMPGVDNLYENENVRQLVEQFNAKDKDFAAICAAPSILGRMGLLKDKDYTCFPGFEEFAQDGNYTGNNVTLAPKIITGKAAGSVHDFALAIIERYLGKEKMEEVKQDIYYNHQ